MFGSKKSTKTTTSESLTNLGSSLTSGGDIQLSAGADILLSGTKATAAGDIGLQAVGGIQLLSAVDQTSSQYQEQKKGTFKVKAKDQGSIKQTAVTSELAGANISLTSGSNIALQGATLTANNTLSMGAATGTLQAVTQDTDGHYVNANGERSTGQQVEKITLGEDKRAILEVKTGKAKESANQTPVYDACQRGQGVGCGGNAKRAGYDNTQAPTQIYTIQPKE